MAKNWWFKFDFKVWRTDSDLRRCSLETRGFWLEILCIMHETGEYILTGSFAELARMVGCESAEAARCVTELKRTNTANVTIGHGEVTIMSRRMERELNIKDGNRLRKQTERQHKIVTTMSQDRVISNKKEVINKSKKEEKKKKNAATAATDQDWLNSLSQNPAYKQTDVQIEFAKAQVWAETNNRQLTRRFFVAWLNRAKPMDVKLNGASKAQVGAWDGNETCALLPPCPECGSDVCLGGQSCADRAAKKEEAA